MKTFFEFINLVWKYLLISITLIIILVALKCFNVTTLGSFGIVALLLTILPGFYKTRKYFKIVEFKGQEIDFLFLSGVAVAIVALPFSIFDSGAQTPDRWGYGIVGGFLLFLIIKSALINIKAALKNIKAALKNKIAALKNKKAP